eukprot:TRINITY_DN5829_c0_g1_i2.p2 TRINITY_DN5829_c0_g1~~TRINITY_DN5829_c0_g1_i2.p2  ORF type:complete len:102 (+),score=16.96 TRINITY_DN5829_c0_g1_i2:265-570(+)
MFCCPKGVVNTLERFQREFLWFGGVNSKKYHLVNWDTACLTYKEGGLNIKRISGMNDALLATWWWKLGASQDDWWVKLVAGKYRIKFLEMAVQCVSHVVVV